MRLADGRIVEDNAFKGMAGFIQAHGIMMSIGA
jgi:hypothetical protein